ncbi:MAG: alkaline phosphatase family protein, partial [Bacteroidota bacterium]|nr:alkaline phosphatase family protein [Bacteroidota bacterium]
KKVKLEKAIEDVQTKIQALPAGSKDLKDAQIYLKDLEKALGSAKEDLANCTTEKYESLSPFHKSIHEKAFAVNSGDPHRHELTPLDYADGDVQRKINIPKGDVLHRFRQDVQNNALPTVSWLVAPETFSDCPGEPWMGAWYVSEVMDILTQNPEVWKKTIFILNYDENDGYFDHVPPFTAPDPHHPESGKVSAGVDTGLEHVKLEEDVPGSIGLGFRVPMIIASPWSRGGLVNSQVFDHTSCIQFLEHFINKKFGKNMEETNITPWRRIVCGNLTSAFRQFEGDKIQGLPFIKKALFIEGIHKAKFKNVPSNYKPLSPAEIRQLNASPDASAFMPLQEKGIRSACAIPYEIYADGNYQPENISFEIIIGAGNHLFKEQAAGSPFIVYALNHRSRDFSERNYAVAAGDRLKDAWQVPDFDNHQYHLRVYGPNGFYREFKGDDQDPDLHISVAHFPNGKAAITFKNASPKNIQVKIADLSYHHGPVIEEINARATGVVTPFDLTESFGWYDFSIKLPGNYLFEKRFAGHVETGRMSKSDPAMS